MKIVYKGEFDGTRAELEAALATYKKALEDHKITIGIPAPWPQYEILRQLVNADDWVLQSEVGEKVPQSSEDRPLTAEELYDMLEAKGVLTAVDRPRPKRAQS